MEGNGRVDTERTSNEQKHSKGWCNAAIFIIFVKVAERFAFYSMVGNLIIYLTDELHEPIPMVAKNVNTWFSASYIFPLFGAFIADSFLGCFKTIILSSIIYCMGLILLTMLVSVIPLHYRKAVFFVALYISSVGEAGHKPCVTTFAADQFDENSPEEKRAKSSFFNWWCFGIEASGSSTINIRT